MEWVRRPGYFHIAGDGSDERAGLAGSSFVYSAPPSPAGDRDADAAGVQDVVFIDSRVPEGKIGLTSVQQRGRAGGALGCSRNTALGGIAAACFRANGQSVPNEGLVVREILFIDPAVPDFAALAGGVRCAVRLVLLDARRDALEQIADALEREAGYDTVHVVAHGAPGRIDFSSGTLSRANLSHHADALARIRAALAPDAELLLWACAAGSGVEGRTLVDALAAATGASVAAATHDIGNAAGGGSWTLDTARAPLAGVPFTRETIANYRGVLATRLWYVTSGENASDAGLNYINADGTNQHTDFVSDPTFGGGSAWIETVIDQTAGFYFVLEENPASGGAATLFRGVLGSSAAPTAAVTFTNPTDADVLGGLQIDTVNHHIYIGYTDYNNTTNFTVQPATTGIIQMDYNPGNGAVSNTTNYLVNEQANPIPSDALGYYSPSDFALGDGALFFVQQAFHISNEIYRVDLTTHAVNVVLKQSDFPANWSGGIINDVEIDTTNHELFFTVSGDTNFPASAAHSGIYRIADTATGSTTSVEFDLSGILSDANFAPGNMTFDPVSRILYVESEETSDGPGLGVPDDVIYAFQVNSTGTAITALLHTFNVGFGNDPSGSVANIGGMAIEQNSPPTAGNNSAETVNEGSSANVVNSAHLSFNDTDDPATSLTYTLTSLAAIHGTLKKSGVALAVNDTFTQDDINNSRITYDHDGGETTAASFAFSLSDGTSTISGQTFNFTVTAVNDAPVALMTTDPYTATEQTALNLKNTGMSVSDVDAFGAVETATLSVTEGTLNVTAGGSGAIVGNSGTSSVTITGTLAQINALLGSDGSSTVSYTDGSDNPSASATLTLHIGDGGNTGTGGSLTGNDTSTINITAVNDAPVATITPASYQGLPNVSVNLKNNGLSVSDIDGNAGSETVTLSVTHGTLTVTAGGSGAGVAGSGTNSVTITGTLAQINALLNTDGTSTVRFDDPVGGPKTLTLLIHDNGNTGGGDLSAQDTANIILDSPPVVDLNGATAGTGSTLNYVENAAASAIAPTGTTTDTDSTDFNTGSLSVHFSANGTATDQLSVLTDGTVTVSAGTVSVGGLAIGTVSGGVNGADLVVSFNTTDATPSSVSTLIEHIGYASSSDNPSTAARSVLFTVNDGDGASGSDTATINVTAANDAPVATITSASYSATEQVNLNLHGTGLSVSDVDGNSGNETVTLSVGEGTITLSAGNSGVGSISGSGTSSLTFSGTLTQLNALLSGSSTGTLIYNDPSDTPVASTTLTLLIHDNGNSPSGDLSASANATINITAVNDAPVALMSTDPYAATENVALDLKNTGMSVSDIDALGAVEVATLSVSQGGLDITAGTSGVTVGGNHGLSVTLTGTLAQINDLLNTNGSSTVSYIDNLDAPAAAATLTLQINDQGNTGTGGAHTGTDTSTINITAVNDAPVATITPASYSATEQTLLNLKNNGLAVGDVDGNTGSETATLSVGEGVLNLTAGGSGATVSNNGTSSVTITGSAAQINALLNSDATSTVSYIDNSDAPAASTALTLLIHDHGNTGGGDLSGSATATINIAAVNDVPVLTGLGDTPAFIENGVSILLDSNSNASVSDADLNGSGSNYAGSTLTLARHGGANSDDVFRGTGSLDLVDVNGNGENVSLDGGATFIGTAVSLGDGTFSIGFNANATAAAIASVMHQIIYSNASDNPPASVQIDFTFSDGNGQPGGQPQGSGAAPGLATGSVTVQITQVDDAPVATIAQPSYSAIEQIGISLKNTGLSVSDVDGNGGIEKATLTVGEGTLNIAAGDSGATVGGDGTASVTITGTLGQINTLLGATGTSTLTYIDNTDGPSPSTQLTLAIDDGGNTGSGGAQVNSAVTTINITPVNDPPTITGSVSGQTITDQQTLHPFSGVTIADPDLPAQTETVSVTLDHPGLGAFTAASLTASGFAANNAIAGEYDFLGTAAAATAAIHQLVFQPVPDTTSNPTLTTTFTIAVSDGALSATDSHTSVIASDATPPAAPSIPDLATASDHGQSNTDNLTNLSTPTFTGTAESGSTVTLYDTNGTTVLGTAVATGGNWSITTSTLTDGDHTVTVRATDAAANIGPVSAGLTVTIDTVAPGAPALVLAHDTGISGTDHLTSNQALVYTLSDNADTLLYKADAAASFSTTAPTFASDGSHTVLVEEQDAAGNVSLATSFHFTLDTTAPTLTGITASPGSGLVHAGSTVEFVFSFNEAVNVSGGTPTLSLDDGAAAVYNAAATAALHDATKLAFDYLVSSSDSSKGSLAVTGFAANGATVADLAGNAATLNHVTASFALQVNDTVIPALPLGGGVVRPALEINPAGQIVLDQTSAAFAENYGIKFLYLGLPASTPYPPVDPQHDFHLSL